MAKKKAEEITATKPQEIEKSRDTNGISPAEYVRLGYERLNDGGAEFTRMDAAEKKLEELADQMTEGERKIFEQKISSKDSVTRAQNRDSQNDTIREELLRLQEQKGGLKKNAQKIGLISFDVRGIKMVNDATQSHRKGNDYLRRITEIAEGVVVNTIKHALKKLSEKQGLKQQPRVQVARDGGDEFSIIISSDVNLDQNISPETIAELFNTESKTLAHIKEPRRLMDLFTELTDRVLAETPHEKILPNEAVEKYLGEKPPEGWKFRSFVAAGGSTLSEILNDPHAEHFKNLVEKPKDATEVLNTFLGVLRDDADLKSNVKKEKQNQEWENSENEFYKFQAKIQARNELTLRLMNERDNLKERVAELGQKTAQLETKLKDQEAELDQCKTEKARLEAQKA